MAMVLITPLTSCVTERIVIKNDVPALTFPAFPYSDDMEVSADKKTVTVSSEWVVRLAEFTIKYEALQEEYESLRRIYNGDLAHEDGKE